MSSAILIVATFAQWIGLSGGVLAQLNLNPPNQLLPPQERPATPSVPGSPPLSSSQPNTQSAVQGPGSATMPTVMPSQSPSSPTFRAAPASFRMAQQPSVAAPQQPPSNALPAQQPTPVNGATVPATAQQVVAPVSDASALTIDSVLTHIQQLQVATDIDATLKQTLITAYEAILAELKSRAESEKVTKEFQVAYEAAPAATAEAKRRKENPLPRKIFEGTLEYTQLETLQSYQLEIQGLAQAATDARTRVEAAIVAREARRRDIPRLIAEDKAIVAKLNEELALPSPEGLDPRVREANALLQKSKLLAINERIRRLEQEQRTYDAELELLPARKDVLLAEEKFQQAKLKEVKDELGKRREIQIADQRRMIEELIAQASPEVKTRAQTILKRADDWLQLAKQNSSLRMEVDSARTELKLWGDRYKIMTEKIVADKSSPTSSRHVTNFNSWVGMMLRKQRSELPDISELRKKLYDYQARSLATDTLILELDDWKASSALADEFSGEPALTGNPTLDQFATAPVLDQKRMLLAIERKLVDEFRVDASNYFENLFSLAVTNQETIEQVYKYLTFIDEHVLWIRSSEPFSKSDTRQLWPSLKWLFDLQNWRSLPEILLKDIQTHLWAYLIGFTCYVALLLNLKRIKRKIADLGKVADRTSCTSYLPTIQVVVLCGLLSMPLAVVHAVLGWRLVSASESNAFANAIGMGLLVGARYFFPLEYIRQICRSAGLAEKHFEWPLETTRQLRKNLRWFIDLAVPSVTIVGVISEFGEARWENSLGRLSFSVLMALCFFYLLNLLHPARGAFAEFLRRNAGGWIDRLRYFWYCGLAAGPIALMVMSLMGYHYTAIRLAMLLHTTFVTLVGLLLLSNLIRRWLLMRRRQIVISQARQRLEEARRRDPSAATATPTAMAASSADSVSDLAVINDQTIRLVRSTLVFAAIAAVAFIWSGVLPAVGVLESIQLWTVEGATASERIPITLAHMLVAVPTIIMTVVAARNLPGLMEIALLQHLPIENAVRYAIASLSRYLILILGIAMTFNSIGVRWASIQWLVAALGVGLGFGLQEIFANFVSGLILLFEQPIRVGDVITLGDTTGVVSRIRMRATTVTNFDQQELVIPNKDLITGRLLNWTLSDSTNRITIQVGISYAADPEFACQLLREICSSHPNVLTTPEPTAFFERFGENALELTARLFLANLEQRLPTKHELQRRILARFNEAGIEISVPQRDLHLKTVPKELLSMFGASKTSAA
jgi:potassium efflux system protein